MLNYCLRSRQGNILDQGQIDNKRRTIKRFIKQIVKDFALTPDNFFCLIENTGLYGTYLSSIVHTLGYIVSVEDALRISKANTRQMDKSDPEDARVISQYALERGYRLQQWQPMSEIQAKLKGLQRRRKNAMKSYRSMLTSLSHSKAFDEVSLDKSVVVACEEAIAKIKKVIDHIDELTEQYILADEGLREIYDRTRTVFGCGPKNTVVILVETWFFTKIKTAKACANYAGLRPTLKTSGTSVRGRSRTSKNVNIRLKTALHHAAYSAATKSSQLRPYYLKKRAEGKTHLQAVNALRNKLCRAIYACHKNKVTYDINVHCKVA